MSTYSHRAFYSVHQTYKWILEWETVKMATKECDTKVQSGFVDDWQRGQTVIQSLRYSLEENILSDVTFIVGENRKRIQAHRLILSLRSCVFMAMLNGPLSEQDDIEIPDIESDIFEQALKFLYTDDVNIDGNNIIRLFYVSKKYQIEYLKEKCLTYVDTSLTSQDVSAMMEDAHVYLEQDLMQKALEYSWENGYAVLKSDSFCGLCYDCFVKVVESDQLNAREELVFEASMAWSEAECRREREITPENIRNTLGESMYLIRYPVLDEDYFDKEVSAANLLTDAEQVKILKCFLYPEKDASPFISKRRSGTVMEITIRRFKNEEHLTMKCSGTVDEGIVFSVNKKCRLQGFHIYGTSQNATL
ncbi:BTB/POZ domain-containing protein 2-like [Gigantopelta aegis]|uniref:BTB/POZ domain-containing protein 2-like n=1 Tax=Gigantopelta aegis TaxID=1735272 RepID=UPI001B8874C2|nr:BTB/POZ domain-containing protein 2-like [Gigantopelta aegis]